MSRSIVLPLVLATGLLAAALTGCRSSYKPLSVDELNELPPQRPAAITLSDPQIYSRETLVNDRRREADYLEELLEKSKTQVFEPQIRRDLRTLTATVLQLQAAFDPLAGKQAERTEELAEIEQRIDETEALQRLAEARVKLIEAERQLDALAVQAEAAEQVEALGLPTSTSAGTGDAAGTGDTGGTGGTSGTGDTGGTGGTAGTGAGGGTPPAFDPAPNKTEVELLRANIEEIKKIIASLPATPEVRQTAVGATPREVFRDRQAYRGELRGALSEVELDDSHDHGQNSLYRLQFRATVLPGRDQDKMAVARLTLAPPSLTDDEVLELYKTWLGHVTYRLNQAVGTELHSDTSYLLLGMGLDRSLFHATCYDLADFKKCGDADTGTFLHIALPPRLYVKWKEATYENGKPELQAIVDQLETIKTDLLPPLFDAKAGEPGDGCVLANIARWRDHVQLLKDLSQIEPFFSASARGLGDLNLLSNKLSSRIYQLQRSLVDGSDTLDLLRYLIQEKSPDCGKLPDVGSDAAQIDAVPDSFKGALLRDCRYDERCTCENKAQQARCCEKPDDRGMCPADVRSPLPERACGEPVQPPAGAQTSKDDRQSCKRVARGGADVYATAPVELAQQISTTTSAVRSFELALALAASLPTEGVSANAGLNRLRTTRADLEARERLPLVVGFAERQQLVSTKGDGKVVGEHPQFGWVFGPQAVLDAADTRLRLRQPVVNQPVTADLSIPGWWPFVELTFETAWVGNWHDGELLLDAVKGSRWGKKPGPAAKSQEFRVYLPLNRADLDALTEYLAKSTVGGALPYTRIAAVSPEKVTTCEDKVTFLVYGANVWRSSAAFLNGLEAQDIRVLPDMAGLAVTFAGIRNGLPQVPGANGEATLTVWTRNGASSARVTVLDPKSAGISCGPVPEPSLKLAVASRVLVPEKSAPALAPIRIRVVQGKLPPSYAKLGISIRPAEAGSGGHMLAWSILPEKGASLLGDVVEGNVTLPDTAPETGTAFQVSVVEIPVPGAEEKRHAVDGPLVYYSTEAESQIRVTPLRLESLPAKVTLHLPRRYDLAFPGLQAGKATFAIKAEGSLADKYQFSLEPPKPATFPDPKGADPTVVLTLAVKKDGQPLTAVGLEPELVALLKEETKLTLTVTGGEALPKVLNTVVLSSKPAEAKK